MGSQCLLRGPGATSRRSSPIATSRYRRPFRLRLDPPSSEIDAGFALERSDPLSAAGDLKEDVTRFSTLDSCVAQHAVLDPVVSDAVRSIGYDTLLRDACRVLQALKLKDTSPCLAITASALQNRCESLVAMELQDPEKCPWYSTAEKELGRDPMCLAVSTHDPRIVRQGGKGRWRRAKRSRPATRPAAGRRPGTSARSATTTPRARRTLLAGEHEVHETTAPRAHVEIHGAAGAADSGVMELDLSPSVLGGAVLSSAAASGVSVELARDLETTLRLPTRGERAHLTASISVRVGGGEGDQARRQGAEAPGADVRERALRDGRDDGESGSETRRAPLGDVRRDDGGAGGDVPGEAADRHVRARRGEQGGNLRRALNERGARPHFTSPDEQPDDPEEGEPEGARHEPPGELKTALREDALHSLARKRLGRRSVFAAREATGSLAIDAPSPPSGKGMRAMLIGSDTGRLGGGTVTMFFSITSASSVGTSSSSVEASVISEEYLDRGADGDGLERAHPASGLALEELGHPFADAADERAPPTRSTWSMSFISTPAFASAFLHT